MIQPVMQNKVSQEENKMTITHQTTIEELYRNGVISVRCYNALLNSSQITNVLELYKYAYNGNIKNIPGVGNKTAKEIKNLLDDLGESDETIMEERFKMEYPYLSSEKRDFVKKFIERYGHRPLFFIIIEYIRASTDKKDVIFRVYSGIDGDKEGTIEKVGRKFGLSREKALQYAIWQQKRMNYKIFKAEELSYYKSLYELPFITDDSPEALEIIRDENLKCSVNSFRWIFRTVSDFCFSSIHLCSDILFSKRLLKFTKLREIPNNLSAVAKARYSKDTKVYLEDLLDNVPEEYYSDVKELVLYLANKKLGMDIVEGNYFLMRRNFIDAEAELYDILKEEGKPMHRDKLLAAFKQKFPEHYFERVHQMQHYLYFNNKNRIKCIGATSHYALTEWEDVYFGSMLQLAYEILDASETPMHIDDIMQKIWEIYPDANEAYLKNVLQGGYKQRFVSLENDYFGLVGRAYSDNYTLRNPLTHDFLFNEGLKRYVDFIETKHRFPSVADGAALNTWRRRVFNSKHKKEYQRKVREVEKKYEKLHYPQNLKEERFCKKCESLKEFVRLHHNLPRNGTNLRQWFTLNKRQYKTFNNFKKFHFNDLLDFLNQNNLLN